MTDLILPLFFLLLLLQWAAALWLEILNLRYARRAAPARSAPEDETRRMLEYTAAKSRLAMLEITWSGVLLLLAVLLGFFPWFSRLITQTFGASIWAEGMFLFGLTLVSGMLSLPLDWYRQFRLEERFGFNTGTPWLWWKDRLLMLLLSLLLVYPFVVLILQIVRWTGDSWWLWVWAAVIAYQLLMLLLVPKFIMPIFNRFSPLPEGSLKERVQSIAARAGVVFKSIQVMDGSKRSRHSNAFLSGLGKFKRIALFDTLIEQMEEEEIEAVVAHEMGHQVKWHLPRRLAWIGGMLLVELYIVSLLIDEPWLIEPFGLAADRFAHGLLVVMLVGGLISFWLSPLQNWLSRRYEYEADRYAGTLMQDSRPMISALLKLEQANLSNPAPHPLYSAFYYSHPTVNERIQALRELPYP